MRADQPVPEVYSALLSRGIYLASLRTMYRGLAETRETRERRNQRLPRAHVKPSLTATAPNQVWTWDITELATIHVGVFLHLYVISPPPCCTGNHDRAGLTTTERVPTC